MKWSHDETLLEGRDKVFEKTTEIHHEVTCLLLQQAVI
jgi:hypothetical protein